MGDYYVVPTITGQPWDPGSLLDKVDHDCEHVYGYPRCMGCAVAGPSGCTCIHLTSAHHEVAERDAERAAKKRRGRMCADCLYRSEHEEDLDTQDALARQEGPFYCHVAMPVHGVSGVPQRDSYAPRDRRLYPLCKGWVLAHARMKRRRGHLEIIK